MARISKKLPDNRADYSFSDLVYWHLLRYGTRPKGNPSAKVGRPWSLHNLAKLLDLDERTLRNWISGKSRPTDMEALADELFGDNELFDEWRFELFEAYRKDPPNELQPVTGRPESSEGPEVRPKSNGRESPGTSTFGAESATPHPPDEPVLGKGPLAGPEIAEQDPSPPEPSFESSGRKEQRPTREGLIILSAESANTEKADRYARYRNRNAGVTVGLAVLLGLYASIERPSKPKKNHDVVAEQQIKNAAEKAAEVERVATAERERIAAEKAAAVEGAGKAERERVAAEKAAEVDRAAERERITAEKAAQAERAARVERD
ncbi:MAG: hypothetical protein QOD40_1723, partial [Alphaproteobacteria bacterium]|nr:hypothetical protein [Alphaproteobacteria bacterium]